jgi:AhpD family alkylhydroperoxidase
VRAVVGAYPRLVAIYGAGRVNRGLRERVMVAVSRANACRGCTRVHEAWAVRVGASAEELQQIGAGELAALPAGNGRRFSTRGRCLSRALARSRRTSVLWRTLISTAGASATSRRSRG